MNTNEQLIKIFRAIQAEEPCAACKHHLVSDHDDPCNECHPSMTWGEGDYYDEAWAAFELADAFQVVDIVIGSAPGQFARGRDEV